MSSDQQENSNEEEEEQQNSQEEQDEDEDDDDQDDDDDDEDQDQDDQDDDQDDDQQQDDDDQDKSGDEDDQSKQQSAEQNKKLPTFKVPQEPFKFTSLLSQISSLSSSVDGLISTFHSSGGDGTSSNYRSYQQNNRNSYKPRLQVNDEVVQQKQRSRIIIMKDQDTQVSMQPQIVIQPTRPIKQETLSPKPYRISNESQKFLAQLYEQNKKLKRWQNTSHPMNTYMTTFSKNSGYGSSTSWNDKSRQKFQRKQYQKGLFNVDQRNKEIDQAIQMLKRESQY